MDARRPPCPDESAAGAARERYRREPMAELPPDEWIAPVLEPGERVLARREPALLERRQAARGGEAPSGLAGILYLTSRRLVLVGRRAVAYDLDEIEEAVFAGDRLRLVLRGGAGITLDVPLPRLLRVELSAARSAARARSPVAAQSSVEPPPRSAAR